MTFDLERFVTAQDAIYASVLDELRNGRKTGHWIWFIFPQVAGLGSSAMSQHYAIGSLDEARAYSPTRCWERACASAPDRLGPRAGRRARSSAHSTR